MRKVRSYRSWLISVAFFLMVFSNIEGRTFFKYIGLIILMLIFIQNPSSRLLPKREGKLALFTLFFFLLSLPFQRLSLFQNFMAGLFYITLIVVTFFGYMIFQEIKDYLFAAIGYCFATIIVFLYSPSKLVLQFYNVYNTRRRLSGGFAHPNSLGGSALAVIVLLLVYKRIHGISGKWKSRFFYIILILMVFLIYCSNSRGAYTVGAVFMITYMLKYVNNFNKKTKLFIYTLIAILIGYILYYTVQYYLEDPSYSSRFIGAFNLHIHGIKYLFGYGMVGADEIDYSVLDEGSMEIAWTKLFYKNGVVGMGLFIMIWVVILNKGIGIKSKEVKNCFFAVFFAFLAESFVESVMVSIFSAFPICFWICLSSIPYMEEKLINNEFV